MEAEERPDDLIGWPDARATDPLLERLKQDIDVSLLEKNLRLTTEERAQQLVNATRFIEKFRPLVQQSHGSGTK
jgi:hypothetical protein